MTTQFILRSSPYNVPFRLTPTLVKEGLLVGWSKQSRPSKETDKFLRKYKEESLCYIFSLPFFSGLLSLSLKCRPRSCHSRACLNGSHDF